jgi:pyrimidine-nucleoside phosphorylase
MRAADLIYSKRQGNSHEPGEIEWLISQYVKGGIPDYQMSAWLMAVFFQGLETDELNALVQSMLHSGKTYDWSAIDGIKADKHSTGGVGDKVSLVLAPLASACGLRVPMVSGRGLGHTGGTLDKLESIPGFNVNITRSRIRRQLKKTGLAMWGQSDHFVPADKKLYALRDVTATVESIPLIVASIMSKKLGEGCDVLVLDIKVGNGAFMTRMSDARKLGRTMIDVGHAMGRKVAAIATDMDQPLGQAIGNSCEVIESIEFLKGRVQDDLRSVTFRLTGQMLILGGVVANQREANHMMQKAIDDGTALGKFRQLISDQDGDPSVIDDDRQLPMAPRKAVIEAPRSGWISQFSTRDIGNAACILGAGRSAKDAVIDHGVSLWCHVSIGDHVEKGQPVFTARYRKPTAWRKSRELLDRSFVIKSRRQKPNRSILAEINPPE